MRGCFVLSDFNELIRNFDKIRDYMRDFYIYGFKSRNDFNHKSARTYDNEKRRISSYMGEFMKWEYSKSGKKSFISMDCSKIGMNPLYAAWKSKAFTANDIMLHFYILDVLKQKEPISIDALTDALCEQSEHAFDVQTVRIKCAEYVRLGLLTTEKKGKALYYSLSKHNFSTLLTQAPSLLEAVKFFQGCAPLGEIGSFILDNEHKKNDSFSFKHNYVAHTLEDGILLQLLCAIRNNQEIECVSCKKTSLSVHTIGGIPLKIFVSVATGRRYLCVYRTTGRRFFNYRLDHIKSVKILDTNAEADEYRMKLDKNLGRVWGVGFGGTSRVEIVSMKLFINEKTEGYVIERIAREGHGGVLVRVDPNVFIYTKEVFDSSDMSPWIKTFMGRIIQLEGTNRLVIDRFYADIKKMKKMYAVPPQQRNEARECHE